MLTESPKKDLLGEIDDVLNVDVVQRHSYFQLKYFLIGKEPTVQSKMWQCLRELKSRRESLAAFDLEVEEAKDRLELLDISIKKVVLEKNAPRQNWLELPGQDNPDYRSLCQQEADIKVRQLERQKAASLANIEQLKDKRRWVEEECRFFLETFKNLRKTEPLKHYDDLESQRQYWGERLANKLHLQIMHPGQAELMETIMALPDDVPIKKEALARLEAETAKRLSLMNMLNDTHKIEAKKKVS